MVAARKRRAPRSTLHASAVRPTKLAAKSENRKFPDLIVGEVSFEQFAVKNTALSTKLRATLKQLFDFSREIDRRTIGSGIPELVTEGFDNEQIWEMLQLENDPQLQAVEKNLSKLLSNSDFTLVSNDDEHSTGSEESENESFGENDPSGDEHSESGASNTSTNHKRDENGVDGEVEESEADDNESDTETKNDAEYGFKTEIDDEFFSIADMERYVDQVEKLEDEEYRKAAAKEAKTSKALKKQEKVNGLIFANDDDADSYDDEESDNEHDSSNELDIHEVDLNLPESEDSDEEVATYTFQDFFGGSSAPKKKNRKSKPESNDDDEPPSADESEAEEESDGAGSSDEESVELSKEELASMTKYEREQYKLKQQIKTLEKQAMGEKDWQLRGEVVSRARPDNSLLEQGDLDVDYLSRPAPMITEETTESLEDVIRRRIINLDFDDVERREAIEREADYRPKLELSMEKSTRGLGEEYAKDYEVTKLGHQTDDQAARTAVQEELHTMFTNLCQKLDSLCNFHYTPKPARAEVTIKSTNVAAIEMEEVIPLAVSAASQAIPTEVFKAEKGREKIDGKTRGEMDAEEKQTVRRSKKAARRKQRRQQEQDKRLVQKLNPGMGNKHAAEKVLESLGNKRVVKGSLTVDSGKSDVNWTRSGQFFKHLQEQVNSSTSGKDDKPKKVVDKAARLRL